jgi:hypothetical protein
VINLPLGNVATPEPQSFTPPVIEVELSCEPNRELNIGIVTVTVAPLGWDLSRPGNSVSFHFEKTCGDLNRNPRLGLDVGTGPDTNDVVQNGVATLAYASDPGKLFGPDFTVVHLYFRLSPASGFPISQHYSVSIEEMSPQIVVVNELGQLAGFLNEGAAAVAVTLGFECVTDGYGRVRLNATVDGYDPFTLLFQMYCAFPRFNLYFGNMPIVNNSVLLNDGALAYTSTDSVGVDTFRVWLSADSERAEQTFQINNLLYDTKNLTVSVVNGLAIASTDPNKMTEFSLQYACAQNHAPSQNTLQFEFDYGWTQSYVVHFTKLCDFHASGGGGSAWTPAGIFFFTVFILLIAFFLFGSMYNYFCNQKRGAEIVPCIGVFRRCYNSICNRDNAHYTPQMPSDYTAHGDKDERRGYGSYTYQSNL